MQIPLTLENNFTFYLIQFTYTPFIIFSFAGKL